MKLKRVNLKRLEIPFHAAFKHAAAERRTTEAVIAIAEDEEGRLGFGEGCPRSYVTGETLDSCEAFLAAELDSILSITSVESLRSWQIEHGRTIDSNPAAWCAVETALLDLLGRIAGKSIEKLLELPPLSGSYRYSAVMGIADERAFNAQLAQYQKIGMTDFKLKVSGDLESDRRNVRAITALPGAKLRLDANNLWSESGEAFSYLSALGGGFWAVEEPLGANDYDAMNQLAESSGWPIILDESFCREDQCLLLEAVPERWIPNVRISKMGGLLRALAVVRRMEQKKVKFVIGAQVGETSILTRLALTLASTARSNVVAQEGAFGTYLLTRDITPQPLMFGVGGLLSAPDELPGLGIICAV